jgi:hypothetical protein
MRTLFQQTLVATAALIFTASAYAGIGTASANDAHLAGDAADAFAYKDSWNPQQGPNGNTSGFLTPFSSYGTGSWSLLGKMDNGDKSETWGYLKFTYDDTAAACRRSRSGRNRSTGRTARPATASSGPGAGRRPAAARLQRSTPPHQVLEVVLRQDEERGADHRAVHRAHAADHDDQQDVGHHLEAERGLGADIAQPQRHQRAGQAATRAPGSWPRCGRPRCGSPAPRRGTRSRGSPAAPARRANSRGAAGTGTAAGSRRTPGSRSAACRRSSGPNTSFSISVKPGDSSFRHAEGLAVLAAGQVRQLRGQHRERGRHRQRDHRVEDGAHAQREQADHEGQHQRQQQREAEAERAAALQVGSSTEAAPGRCRRRRSRRTSCARRRRCRCSRAAGRRTPPARCRRRWWRPC